MARRIFPLILLTLAIALSSSALNAQIDLEKKAEFENWNFRINPFFWYVGINGEIKSPPQPSQLPEVEPSFKIDIPFNELRNSLKFFLMLSSEYNKNRVIVLFGVTSLILEGDAVTPLDLILQDTSYRFTYLASELSGGYRLIDKEKVKFDALLGLRMLYTRITASSKVVGTTFTGERQVFWYDPILAFRALYIPHYRVEFTAYTDFGPIREVDSYQIFAQGKYLFSKVFNLALGYRQYFANSRRNEAIFKGSLYGPYIKFGFQF